MVVGYPALVYLGLGSKWMRCWLRAGVGERPARLGQRHLVHLNVQCDPMLGRRYLCKNTVGEVISNRFHRKKRNTVSTEPMCAFLKSPHPSLESMSIRIEH